jgi:sensor histidine kinase YesM
LKLSNNKWLKNTSNTIPIKYHIWFWLSYFAFNVIRWGSYYEDYWYSFKSNLVTFSLSMILVYFNIYFLFPKFIVTKKYKKYILFLLITLCVFYIVRTELIYVLINKNVWPESETPQKAYSFNHIVVVFLIGIYDIALVTTIKLTTDWIYERKRVENLQKVQLKTELQFLKAQIQPHFFFNTLNNLYALTLEKSDTAPRVVLKLSEIMQYVLYDVKEPKISLLTAINYIQNYLDLERLRYSDKITTKINIIGNIENVLVPPLIFLPFIENCFKHGANNNEHLEVDISFENLSDKWLIFKVENSFENKVALDNNKKSGIGIQNVKRRLELLFKDKFELKTNIVKQKFQVYLKFPIQ